MSYVLFTHFCIKDVMIPFAVWQESKIFYPYTSGPVCRLHVYHLKLAQDEHSWSVLFQSSQPACLYVRLDHVSPQKGGEAAATFLITYSP